VGCSLINQNQARGASQDDLAGASVYLLVANALRRLAVARHKSECLAPFRVSSLVSPNPTPTSVTQHSTAEGLLPSEDDVLSQIH